MTPLTPLTPLTRLSRLSRLTRLGLIAAAAAALLVTACTPAVPAAHQVANPAPDQTVPSNWGSNIEPAQSDVLYTAGGSRGCGPNATDSACGGSQTLDIYPANGRSKGTIVWIHGGGFAGGDKDLRSDIGPLLHQTQQGWDFVSINYRLANIQNGTNLFPTAITDVESAISWLRANGNSAGLNTSKIITAGHSAGGTLATLAGVASNTGNPSYASVSHVDGYMSFSGIMEFSISDNSLFWGSYWFPGNSQTTTASPAYHLDPSDPPGYLVHGDSDPSVDIANAQRMKNIAIDGGYPNNVLFDIVDAYADGTAQPISVRGHIPAGGANSASISAWLDRR